MDNGNQKSVLEQQAKITLQALAGRTMETRPVGSSPTTPWYKMQDQRFDFVHNDYRVKGK